LVENKVVKGYYALQQDKIICMLLVAVYNKKAYALFIGADEAAYKLGALYFVYFNTIKQLKSEEYSYLNVGGVINDLSGAKLIYAKTSLGAVKHVCWGGETNNLIGNISNLLTNIYSKTRKLIK
jgi:lipid II:glycine glycyltransferase (peptidoglycan interpeptide bridge formation enzyme)